MAESNLLALPAQAKSHPAAKPPNADNPLYEMRRKRAIALVPTVRPVDGGFRVSSSCREIRYLVTQPNGHRVCTCPDFLNHEAEAGFRCKHVWAVEMALEAGLFPEAANGNGNGNGRPSPEGLSFASLEQLMNACLQASWAAWCALEEGPAFSGEDVRAVAITLFLECARKGIVLQPVLAGEERHAAELPF